MEKIAQKFLENQNLNKEEFVKLIRCAHDPEVRELLAGSSGSLKDPGRGASEEILRGSGIYQRTH